MRLGKTMLWIGGLTLCFAGALEGAARTWGPQLLPSDNSRDVAPGEALPGAITRGRAEQRSAAREYSDSKSPTSADHCLPINKMPSLRNGVATTEPPHKAKEK